MRARLPRLLGPLATLLPVVVAAVTCLAQAGQVFGSHIPFVVSITWSPIGIGNPQMGDRHHHFVWLTFPADAPGTVSDATPLAAPASALFDRERGLLPIWRVAQSVPHYAASRFCALASINSV